MKQQRTSSATLSLASTGLARQGLEFLVWSAAPTSHKGCSSPQVMLHCGSAPSLPKLKLPGLNISCCLKRLVTLLQNKLLSALPTRRAGRAHPQHNGACSRLEGSSSIYRIVRWAALNILLFHHWCGAQEQRQSLLSAPSSPPPALLAGDALQYRKVLTILDPEETRIAPFFWGGSSLLSFMGDTRMTTKETHIPIHLHDFFPLLPIPKPFAG